jgi:DNA-binding XRE family transcriptional regulator
MDAWTKWEDLKKELLADPEFKAEVDKLEPQFRLVRSLIACRRAKGLSQAALAEKVGTKQAAIARLESGRANPTLKFLLKVADALDAEVELRPR